MIKPKYHRVIASILLGCMLVVSFPIHNFMHNHDHSYGVELSSDNSHSDTTVVEKEHSNHLCIACLINQIAVSYFVKSANNFSVLHFAQDFTSVDTYYVISLFSFSTRNKAPPVLFV